MVSLALFDRPSSGMYAAVTLQGEEEEEDVGNQWGNQAVIYYP